MPQDWGQKEGVAMLIFEVEAVYNHVKGFFVKEEA